MKVYIIRHGQTTCNAVDKHQGWGPISLSEKGFAQAIAAREYIDRIHFDKIYASDLLRARQTAEILFPNDYKSGNIGFDADIREIDTGAFYGKTFNDLYKIFGDEYASHRRDMDYAPFGAEGSFHFRERVEHFMKKLELESENSKIAVVAHGGVIGTFANIVCGVPKQVPIGRFPLRVANCSVNVFRFEKSNGWCIEQMNYHGQLD